MRLVSATSNSPGNHNYKVNELRDAWMCACICLQIVPIKRLRYNILGQLMTWKWRTSWHSIFLDFVADPSGAGKAAWMSRCQGFCFYLIVSKNWYSKSFGFGPRSIARCRKSCGCHSDPYRVETASVNVPQLILLFPQDSIRQKGSSLIVTVRIWEVRFGRISRCRKSCGCQIRAESRHRPSTFHS